MPKVQPTSHTISPYWKHHHSHCRTDAGRQLLTAVRDVFRDIAWPSFTEHEDGHIQIYWVTSYRAKRRRPARVLEALFPPGSKPDDTAAVTCRNYRGGQTVTEHGDLTLEQIRPLALELTDHWNRNVWQPSGYRKQDGPYLITVQAKSDTDHSGSMVWRVYRDDRIIREGTGYSWQATMRIAEAARNEAARADKHNRANASRYRATQPHPRPIHYAGEPQPDGRPTTRCGKVCFGGRRRGTRVHGRWGADAEAPGASVCVRAMANSCSVVAVTTCGAAPPTVRLKRLGPGRLPAPISIWIG